MLRSLVGSEMCIRDSINAEYMGLCLCLESAKKQDLKSCLSLMDNILKQDHEIVQVYAETIINACIKILLNHSEQDMDTLIRVIMCLSACSRFKGPDIAKIKKKVVSTLQTLLEHKKRLVRRSAVYAVNQWYIMQ
eukprot:TRINITY_DN3662_c0_g1_i5.p1 TRINITY_DN3662_c0_g1~~TRINITY_DN3662_c0_g1_i5.p1  ORF type:complete len:135 (+),score=16.50 TRINITY_DN3662_c0_g1_i5:55-459(+)